MKNKASTIAAIATPAGEGGIAVIRLSGGDAVKIVSRILQLNGKKLSDRKAVLTVLNTGDIKDEVIVIYFQSPRSYTGEDVVEIQCHGNYFLAVKICEALIENGAEQASPGEFTRRAFLNGKMDLTKAEGVMDLITSQSVSGVNAAFRQMSGVLSGVYENLQKKISALIASVAAAVDYPEDDVIEAAVSEVLAGVLGLLSELTALKESYHEGAVLKDGVRVAITGETNVGKSSILNRLLGRERAIVSDIPGTTRDTVEEFFVYKGIKFVIVDTAGIRKTTDPVEKIGIERSEQAIRSADLILAVSEPDKEFKNTFSKTTPVIFAVNKTDLLSGKQAEDSADKIYISAKTGENFNRLQEAMYAMTAGKISGHGIKLNNLRHLSLISSAIESLGRAAESASLSLDCLLSDLTEALRKIGEITGANAADEVVDAIFSKFCVGK